MDRSNKPGHSRVNLAKLKLSNVIESKTKLETLAEMDLPIKVSYWISRAISKSIPELKIYETKRIQLCEKLGKLNKEENRYEFTPENEIEYHKKYKELVDIEIDLDIEKIKILDYPDLKIKPSLLLEWLFD